MLSNGVSTKACPNSATLPKLWLLQMGRGGGKQPNLLLRGVPGYCWDPKSVAVKDWEGLGNDAPPVLQ
jgi:hypothetical protein